MHGDAVEAIAKCACINIVYMGCKLNIAFRLKSFGYCQIFDMPLPHPPTLSFYTDMCKPDDDVMTSCTQRECRASRPNHYQGCVRRR